MAASHDLDLCQVVLLGSSYIRRLGDFIASSDEPDVRLDFELNRQFASEFRVSFHGIGGAGIREVLNCASAVITNSPNHVSIAVLHAGGNDINGRTDAVRLATQIAAGANFIHVGLGVEQVLISQLFFRDRACIPNYNDVVLSVNHAISKKVKENQVAGVVFWRHGGFWEPSVRASLMHRDGVHFNNSGNSKFYKSLKTGLIRATKRMFRAESQA